MKADEALKHVPEMNEGTGEETKESLTRTQKWKTPGIHHIQTYEYKHFKSVHAETAKQVNKPINNPDNTPEFLIQEGAFDSQRQ
jgi:hypothetical protein